MWAFDMLSTGQLLEWSDSEAPAICDLQVIKELVAGLFFWPLFERVSPICKTKRNQYCSLRSGNLLGKNRVPWEKIEKYWHNLQTSC